jgi:REP element-mobilizing transposase RayT
MNRGVLRQSIFRDDRDHSKFLSLLGRAAEKFGLEIFCYALVRNHFHLLLRTPKPNLSEALRWLQSAYGGYFNWRHERQGHVFQGRYKSIVVEDESYLLTLSNYIHWNPARAGLTKDARKYRWSSFRDYLSSENRHGWLQREAVLHPFGKRPEQQRTAYRRWTRDNRGKDRSFLEKVRHGILLGGDDFVQSIREVFGLGEKGKDISQKKTVRSQGAIDAVVREVCRLFKTPRRTLTSDKGRGRNKSIRDLAIFILWKHSDLTNKVIGEAFGVKYSTVTKAGVRVQKQVEESEALGRKAERIRKRVFG